MQIIVTINNIYHMPKIKHRKLTHEVNASRNTIIEVDWLANVFG